MKNFIYKIFLFSLFFALFTVLINSIFLVVIALTDWDFVKRRESLNFNNPDYDLLVLGTSLAEYGFDTKLLTTEGIKSYNLAFVGSSARTNYIQLEEYLEKYIRKPRYVVYGVNSYLERFDNGGIQPVVEFTMKGHKFNIRDIPISKFNWSGTELIKKILRKQYRETYVSYGQKRCTYSKPDQTVYTDIRLDLVKYEDSFWIGEMAKLCNQNGINLIIMDMPGEMFTQNRSEIGPYKLSFCNGAECILYNFNNQEFCRFIDKGKDWAGLSHFNKYGAEKFTMQMFKIVFTDHYVGGSRQD